MNELTELPEKKENRPGKFIKLFLKIVVTIVCFWYISTKIDFSRAWAALLQANWFLLFLAVLFYLISKIVSAIRLNIYFRNIHIHLSQWINMKLYWLGMFYNMFLPGSISGDAYKVIILAKRMQAPYKKTATAVLLDRFSGMLGLGVLLCLFGLFVIQKQSWELIFGGATIAAVVTFYFIVRYFFNEFISAFWITAFLGLIVQAIQIGTIYFIMKSLNITEHHPQWIFIFLIASIVSVLPISLGGGLGTREFVFLQGANFFNLDPHIGIIISLLFYLCTLLVHVWGFYFNFKDPLKIR